MLPQNTKSYIHFYAKKSIAQANNMLDNYVNKRHEKETNFSHYLRKGMDWKQNCSVVANTVPSPPHSHHKEEKPSLSGQSCARFCLLPVSLSNYNAGRIT